MLVILQKLSRNKGMLRGTFVNDKKESSLTWNGRNHQYDISKKYLSKNRVRSSTISLRCEHHLLWCWRDIYVQVRQDWVSSVIWYKHRLLNDNTAFSYLQHQTGKLIYLLFLELQKTTQKILLFLAYRWYDLVKILPAH